MSSLIAQEANIVFSILICDCSVCMFSNLCSFHRPIDGCAWCFALLENYIQEQARLARAVAKKLGLKLHGEYVPTESLLNSMILVCRRGAFEYSEGDEKDGTQ